MISDDTFNKIVLTAGIFFLVYIKLEEYGYKKAIFQLSKISESLLIVFISSLVMFFILKKVYYVVRIKHYRKRQNKIEKLPKNRKQQKTKKQTSKNPINAKPKTEILQDTEDYNNEELSLKPKAKRKVNINVDGEVKFHKFKELNEDEVRYLLRQHFKLKTYFNPFIRKREKFVFKTNGHESDSHFLMIHIIKDYLKNKVDNIKTFQTVKPDIVFEINKKKYAIEVETGKTINHARKQLKVKLNLLNKNYDDWFFVVLKQNLISRYRKFGKVFDKRYLKNQLDKLLKNTQNSIT